MAYHIFQPIQYDVCISFDSFSKKDVKNVHFTNYAFGEMLIYYTRHCLYAFNAYVLL